jgi:hypothetical protein
MHVDFISVCLFSYQEGINLLSIEMQQCKDPAKSKYLESKIRDYLSAAEKVKEHVVRERALPTDKPRHLEKTIKISEDQTGCGCDMNVFCVSSSLPHEVKRVSHFCCFKSLR